MQSRTHNPDETNLMDASEVIEVSRHEMHHTGQVHTAVVDHTIRMDHKQPSLTERAEHAMKYELHARVDSVRTMKLLGTTVGRGGENDGPARVRSLSRLRQDTPILQEEDQSRQ